jgi:hypothetical protein
MARALVPEGDHDGVRRFARAYVDSGGSARAAAEAIGAQPGGAREVGERLLGRADVQAAVVQATRDKADALAPMMLSVLARLALDSDVRPATRKDAALGILGYSNIKISASSVPDTVQDGAVTIIATIQADRAKRMNGDRSSQAIDITPQSRPGYCPVSQTERLGQPGHQADDEGA